MPKTPDSPDHRDRSFLALVARLSACCLPVVLAGCLPPAKQVEPSPSDPPALTAIRSRFEQVVNAAKTDPNTNWHSSWTGNMVVNTLKGANRGLCYQWQDYVYRGVAPTAERYRWGCTGLVANEGNPFEHHVVLVWDLAKIDEERILTTTPPRPVYVLDAWYEGTPNMHWLDDWLDHEAPHRVPPRLQQLPEEYIDPSDPVSIPVPNQPFQPPLPMPGKSPR